MAVCTVMAARENFSNFEGSFFIFMSKKIQNLNFCTLHFSVCTKNLTNIKSERKMLILALNYLNFFESLDLIYEFIFEKKSWKCKIRRIKYDLKNILAPLNFTLCPWFLAGNEKLEYIWGYSFRKTGCFSKSAKISE